MVMVVLRGGGYHGGKGGCRVRTAHNSIYIYIISLSLSISLIYIYIYYLSLSLSLYLSPVYTPIHLPKKTNVNCSHKTSSQMDDTASFWGVVDDHGPVGVIMVVYAIQV